MVLLTPVIIIIIIVIIIFAVTVVPGHLHIHTTLAKINEHHTLTHISFDQKTNIINGRLYANKCPSTILEKYFD